MQNSKNLEHLFTFIRESLSSAKLITQDISLPFKYNKDISQIYITIFEKDLPSIRWGSKKESFIQTINRIITKLRTNKDFHKFDIKNTTTCRIMLEIITKEYPCNIKNITTMRMFSENRFEPGVNGLKYKYKGITRFFMPTDAFTKSIMSVNQLLNYLSKQCEISKITNKISERVHLMRREKIEYTFIDSLSYISFEEKVLKLERGYPTPTTFSKEAVLDKTLKSIDWLVKNMNEDGSFLYYYDPYKNTIVDDVHPKMINPLYNNILRHSGGTVSLLRGFELSQNKLYLDKAKKSIEFLLSTCREHEYKNKRAMYPFFNQKSKLGGAGIGLVALMHYYNISEDNTYLDEMTAMVRHILSRVDADGEMIGYYIHPKFNNGEALVNPTDEVKKELFSFYYPGEALLGLALYYLHVDDIDKDLKKDIEVKSKMALDFLVDIRPIKYDYMFDTLPADAWLMQAIEEWVKVDGFKKQSYIDFVFNDTKTMFEHMYTDINTLDTNKDYIGGFYYDYGDHVYHDASRCEGIVSAYFLAKYLKDESKASWIMDNMLLSAQGLMKTFNSREANYSHQSDMALNSFRFKLTRQWVRVDSVQHAACFFARFLQTDFEKQKYKNYIDNFEVINKISSAGYSDIYLVKKDGLDYALKYIKNSDNLKLIKNEEQILNIMNQHNNLKLHFCKITKNLSYFIFDYTPDNNLRIYIKNNGVLSENEALKLLQNIIDTLEFMKTKNILHLDIKPANILLYKASFVLSDFGHALISKTTTTKRVGNSIYIAPEYYGGTRDYRSDIYALGCTLYFALTAQNVFNLKKQDSYEKIRDAHLHVEIDLSLIKSNFFKTIISRMLDKNKESRIDLSEIQKKLDYEL